MHYMQRIAVAALAGAVVSSVVFARRNDINRLVHAAVKNRDKARWRNWYQANISEFDEYSAMDAEQYVKNNDALLTSLAERKGYSGGEVDKFKMEITRDVREFIVAHHKAQIAKMYADSMHKLYAIKHRDKADDDRKTYVDQAHKLEGKLEAQGCDMKPLMTAPEITLPY